MGMFDFHHPWAFVFGLLGNILSFMVYLAPVPTFRRIYRNKSTEGFQSFPYVVALFSAMQLIYYAIIKTNTYLLITVNTAGCIIETIYISMYLTYAPKKAKIHTIKTMVLLNGGLFSVIVLGSFFFFKGANRLKVVGWINMTFSVSVFAAPLSIIRLVIRTKSVEFMPFNLSLFLTLSAIAWFFYGLLTKDIYVAFPNILGFSFGVIQMVLYIVYKDAKPPKLPENEDDIKKSANSGVEMNKVEATAMETAVTVANDNEEREREKKETGGNKKGLGNQEEVTCQV